MAGAITSGMVFLIVYDRLCGVDYLTWGSLICRHIIVDIATLFSFEKTSFSCILEVGITYMTDDGSRTANSATI